VENVIFYLSSTDVELEMIVGAKELCSKEFNKMLVHRRFGIQEKEWEGYVAFVAEVDEELKRRGMYRAFDYLNSHEVRDDSQDMLKRTLMDRIWERKTNQRLWWMEIKHRRIRLLLPRLRTGEEFHLQTNVCPPPDRSVE
jgi:hypothetical protein